MPAETKKRNAILVVSFGTSYEDTRKKTIDAIEERIARAYPEWTVYRAWTSRMIIKKIRNRDGLHIDTVTEAMERMAKDGIRQVVVQPTHVINGIENEQMIRDALAFEERFEKIVIGAPLLTSDEDSVRVIRTLAEETGPLSQGEAVALYGTRDNSLCQHCVCGSGLPHEGYGIPKFLFGNCGSLPVSACLKTKAERRRLPKRALVPVYDRGGGPCQRHDMASGEEDSWKCQLEEEGYEIRCRMKGLGEYRGIQELFLDHIADALKGN